MGTIGKIAGLAILVGAAMYAGDKLHFGEKVREMRLEQKARTYVECATGNLRNKGALARGIEQLEDPFAYNELVHRAYSLPTPMVAQAVGEYSKILVNRDSVDMADNSPTQKAVSAAASNLSGLLQHHSLYTR